MYDTSRGLGVYAYKWHRHTMAGNYFSITRVLVRRACVCACCIIPFSLLLLVCLEMSKSDLFSLSRCFPSDVGLTTDRSVGRCISMNSAHRSFRRWSRWNQTSVWYSHLVIMCCFARVDQIDTSSIEWEEWRRMRLWWQMNKCSRLFKLAKVVLASLFRVVQWRSSNM